MLFTGKATIEIEIEVKAKNEEEALNILDELLVDIEVTNHKQYKNKIESVFISTEQQALEWEVEKSDD